VVSKHKKYKTIDELIHDINKLEDNLLIRGAQANPVLPRTTTGILAYDVALGGGWPLNQWNEIIGEESAGKTAIAYRSIAANQQRDSEWTALWVAAEEFVPDYAESFGVDLNRLLVVESNEMEQALDIVLNAVENRAVDGVVIDSIPALVTHIEVEKKAGDASVATAAQILSRFFKKSSKAQRRSLVSSDDRPCLLIALNQWRDKIGVLYGDPRTTPGGKAKNYYFFTRVEVRRDDWISESTSIDSRVGQVIKMRSLKNKTYRPSQVAQVDFYFSKSSNGFERGQFDLIKDIVNVCLSLDVFTGRYKLDDERIASSKEELYEVVRSRPELAERLRERALTGISNVPNEPESDE
jgi:recombination protein RecA